MRLYFANRFDERRLIGEPKTKQQAQYYDLHAQDFYHCGNAILSIEEDSRSFPKYKITLQFECDSYSMETLRKNLIY